MASEPEPSGGTEYAAYLLIDDLLGLQRPITPEAHDELLFIIVHQAYELWFKLMLDQLARASGFQSRQFREIERASPRLYEAFCEGSGLPAGEGAHDARIAALADLYRDHADDPARTVRHEVCERLVDHDETIQRWRFHHTLMAAREIGSRPGTGGSRGVEYLRGTVDQRFYPELWEVRVAL